MGGAQMGTIFETDISSFLPAQLCDQDIKDMQAARPEQLGRFIAEAIQSGNHALGYVALGVLASAAIEPIPYEVKKGLWGRERRVYNEDAQNLQKRRITTLGKFMHQFYIDRVAYYDAAAQESSED